MYNVSETRTIFIIRKFPIRLGPLEKLVLITRLNDLTNYSLNFSSYLPVNTLHLAGFVSPLQRPTG
jgi:hypothetical protein